MFKTVRVLSVILLLIAFGAAPALADAAAGCGICEHAESDSYAVSAPGKIGRGLVNAGLGWTNLFAQPTKSVRNGENFFAGVGKGFAHTFIRTLQGVVELGTFFLPPFEEPVKNCSLGDMGITGR